ncbi:phage major tail tube protein [Asticcacaulis machinosus]|uniref:Phage major tail tube protein n=1 Tax=Asticcacaulis machinosus TaxID=2984211 RepID=A0ABT5HGL0_9CAUL|nr:phage major tail tube protein [Asticcacaulis machinosus]MDC7675388.1 phage major tail tube protein [Asticcacaulis machinosus]
MSLPSILKFMQLFVDGGSFLGQIPEVTLPNIALKLVDYRAGGMLSEAKIEMGVEPIEFEWKAGGLLVDAYRQFGVPTLDGTQLRWVGGYQSDDTNKWTRVEIVMRGRHGQIAPGTAKAGELGDKTITTHCPYYRLEIDGRTVIEIDILAPTLIIDGVDRLAGMRAALDL